MGSTAGIFGFQPYQHEDSAITAQATLRSISLSPDRNVDIMNVESTVKSMTPKARGWPSRSTDEESSLQVKNKPYDAEPLLDPHLRPKTSRRQDLSLGSQAGQAKATHRSLSVPSDVKMRQHLRLPSFKSLGITPVYPDALLTPPDEASLIHWTPSHPARSDPPLHQISTEATSEHSQASMPEAPSLSDSISEGHSNAAPAPAVPQVAEQKDVKDDQGSASGSDEASESPSWIDTVAEAIVTAVASAKGTSNVLNVLCHTQPCPLSEDVNNVPTAFTPIITALQTNVEPNHDRYIEVTHAVPRKFDMAHLPTSPVGTPSQTDGGDYFSLGVYSKAVIAVDHQNASNSSYPSSPRPVVAPSSVGVSILERFIPPTTTSEYLDLFSNDGPSVLVDRLYELSSAGGRLIFIYPTLGGANTFTTKYLGPLLDPLLRTMVGVHGLSADLGADVGKMAAVDHMLSYSQTADKIKILLRKLSRGNSLGRSVPKYSMEAARCEKVEIDRAVWASWWVHQEATRIRETMNRYFQRAIRLPQRDITAGTLVREILDGVGSRADANHNARRDGIEVGVFILRRTA